MKKIHDYGYRYLFSHPGFVRQLLKNFIAMDWVNDIDFENMEKVDASFVPKNYKKKESDVLYKLNSSHGPVYLYMLIEFQSTVDKLMPFRMISYVSAFYEEFNRKHKEEKESKRPSLFPVVVYNGDDAWTVPDNVKDLIEPFHLELSEYVPSLKYFPVIINKIPKPSLLKIRNALSAVFLVENLSEEEAEEYIGEIIRILAKELPDLREAFKNWFSHLFHTGRKSAFKDLLDLDEKEAKAMFATTLDKIEKRGEHKKAIQTAKKMAQEGFDISMISRITELPIEELKKVLDL